MNILAAILAGLFVGLLLYCFGFRLVLKKDDDYDSYGR